MTELCQSCGMPLKNPEDYGKEANGEKNQEYCRHCYQEGKFTEPEITLSEMVKRVTGILKRKGFPEKEVRKAVEFTLPGLKRWKKQPNKKNLQRKPD